MKKIVIILLPSFLLYGLGKATFKTLYSHRPPATVIHEVTFVNIIRDLELLNSWLLNRYDPKETIDILHHQNHQKILALYKVDPKTFKESVKYYLEASSERALTIYEKVYVALQALASE
ncbi:MULTISPECIES: DUF4296 domain-containing protein [unclassified Candidatus Cardinium]|uniref:DUF4296 domain-containing protein n=1 Tax=unclassified Candidatus Cardinium TaxID=2641185 RepID=UPI001FB28794|nr:MULTISPECIES: DUF4296 domain-containing protein [unclassified Candidatus Cardinium]